MWWADCKREIIRGWPKGHRGQSPSPPATYVQWPGPSLPLGLMISLDPVLVPINANHAVDFLPEEHNEVYGTRVEASRRAAWAKFETTLATLRSGRFGNYLRSQAKTRRAF